ncbi:DUF262 domain-containing protein [Companilactobacillus sp.]|uniref:DUF262 domain-containing protein n=1 Tax=Companilactobacillus sp. TaxID=2767905 RepID=UPI00262909AB|nr:DUF262 domain-containing HNH endonuclease family protein [Companilactobacillus sp.]
MYNYEDLIQAQTKNLGKYLQIDNDSIFIIPFSQRDYEWGKTEITRLFNDLTYLYQSSDDEIHMLNFFTFSRDDSNNLRIFDGQQRTVTCLLILASIAQRLYQQGKEDAAKQIRSDYFVKHDSLRKNSSEKRKLQFDSEEDNEYFYRVTNIKFDPKEELSQKNVQELKGNCKTFAKNMHIIEELIDKFIENRDKVELTELATSITDKTLIVQFIAKKEDIALNMFESLNNTGKNIDKYYVLKNDMVKSLGEDNVKRTWNNIDSQLDELNHNEFLVTVATIFAGKTNASNVLKNLYMETDTNAEGEMKKLLSFLKEASEKFLWICMPNQIGTNESKREKDEYRELTNQISLFSMKQHRPIVLALLLQKKNLSEINKVLKTILDLTVKNFYFDEQKANKIEVKYANYAKEIFNHNLSVQKLIEKIEKLCISDAQFKNAILNKEIPKNRKISFILRKTYNYKYKKGEVEVSNNNDVEHILPRTPKKNSQWLGWFSNEEQRKKYTYSIGNLTLWSASDNRSAQNAEFADKKKQYKESQIEENIKISEKNEWTINEINNRSQYMADEIIRAFRNE